MTPCNVGTIEDTCQFNVVADVVRVVVEDQTVAGQS